jgi:hypothetical protein
MSEQMTDATYNIAFNQKYIERKGSRIPIKNIKTHIKWNGRDIKVFLERILEKPLEIKIVGGSMCLLNYGEIDRTNSASITMSTIDYDNMDSVSQINTNKYSYQPSLIYSSIGSPRKSIFITNPLPTIPDNDTKTHDVILKYENIRLSTEIQRLIDNENSNNSNLREIENELILLRNDNNRFIKLNELAAIEKLQQNNEFQQINTENAILKNENKRLLESQKILDNEKIAHSNELQQIRTDNAILKNENTKLTTDNQRILELESSNLKFKGKYNKMKSLFNEHIMKYNALLNSTISEKIQSVLRNSTIPNLAVVDNPKIFYKQNGKNKHFLYNVQGL